MFSKQEILVNLNNQRFYIDMKTLEKCLLDWKIDPIYQNEESVEYFDDISVSKITKGIQLKSQGLSPEDIVLELQTNSLPVRKSTEEEEEGKEEIINKEGGELPVNDPNSPPQSVQDSSLPEQVQSETAILNAPQNIISSDLNKVTLDVSGETLELISKSIADKITANVSNYINESDFISSKSLQNDNVFLSEQIDLLIKNNKILLEKIEVINKELTSFRKIAGNIYIKLK